MTGRSEERRAYLRRFNSMKSGRTPWLSRWRDLAQNFAPMVGRFDDAEKDGKPQRNVLLNSAPVRAARVLAAGMMTSVTSPARKWFRLSLPGPQDDVSSDVRGWLEQVEDDLFKIFKRSNIYSALSEAYLECAVFGTHAFMVEEDDEDVVRAYSIPVGTYCLASSHRRAIDTMFRDVFLTVHELVGRFGLENCSSRVKELYRGGILDERIHVIHVVEPDAKARGGGGDYRSKPWKSVWFEADAREEDGFLKEAGYHEFPVMAPRWSVVDNGTYGTDSPGMVALGDAKHLQMLEANAAKLVEAGTEPALLASASMRNQKVSLRPADITFGDSQTGAPAAAPIYSPSPVWLAELKEKTKVVEDRIAAAFFVDLFLSLLDSDRREITAEEIRGRQQEKMLQLGPVLERLDDELLDPLISRVFSIAYRKGMLPPMPEGIGGQAIRVEYKSILTQAQKTVGVAAVQQWMNSVGALAQLKPEVLDNVDIDRVARDMADMFGVPALEVVDMDGIRAVREARADMQARQMALQEQTERSIQAKNLGQARMDGTALPEVLNATAGERAPL
ncbi:MAG: portal protein [Akkermansia sp.]|nr:portal protein [Akkermansia sp.]